MDQLETPVEQKDDEEAKKEDKEARDKEAMKFALKVFGTLECKPSPNPQPRKRLTPANMDRHRKTPEESDDDEEAKKEDKEARDKEAMKFALKVFGALECKPSPNPQPRKSPQVNIKRIS